MEALVAQVDKRSVSIIYGIINNFYLIYELIINKNYEIQTAISDVEHFCSVLLSSPSKVASE